MPLHRVDNADLSALNSFRVAARARTLVRLARPEDGEEAATLLAESPRSLVLGAGSNVLFTADFEGTVVQVDLRGRRIVEPAGGGTQPDSPVIVEAAAGEPWHEFVLWTLEQGLYGLENLALIPGSVGAAPVQNIGAYGVELSQCLDSVDAIDIDAASAPRRMTAQACRLGYRNSIFRRTSGRSRWLIVSVRFALSRVPQPRLDYPDLKAAFAKAVSPPSPREIAEAVCRIRAGKLPDPARIGNAGSFFRNPTVAVSQARELSQQYPGLPTYPAGGSDGCVKIPAAWLIDRCGWKGQRRGDAGVHADHALVLVNHGRASGAEIIALANQIRDSVAERFGVLLEPEVVVV